MCLEYIHLVNKKYHFMSQGQIVEVFAMFLRLWLSKSIKMLLSEIFLHISMFILRNSQTLYAHLLTWPC